MNFNPFAWTMMYRLASTGKRPNWYDDRGTVHFMIKHAIFNSKEHVPCCHCSVMLALEKATLEHIRPVSLGGDYHPSNLTIACGKCNKKRGNLGFLMFRKERRRIIQARNAKHVFLDDIPMMPGCSHVLGFG